MATEEADIVSLDPITAVFSLGKAAIERIWPDEAQRAGELRKLEELHQKGDLAALDAHVKLMLAQISVNQEQAKSKSFWVAGARPAAIWAGVAALIYSGLIYPLLTWAWRALQAFGYIPAEFDPPPIVEPGQLGAITAGLLGVAGMRSYDKRHGVQTDRLH